MTQSNLTDTPDPHLANGIIEIGHFTVRPEATAELLARRPAMLAAVRRHCPGFVSAHLAHVEGDRWVDVAFWESREQCQLAMERAPTVPEIAQWLALIDQDLGMELAITAELPIGGRAPSDSVPPVAVTR